MQDSVGKFVEINIACAGAGLPAVVSKEIAFDDHAWSVHCYPRGAPGEAGAGGHLSIHLVNHTNVRKVLFEAIMLRRAASRDVGTVASSCPSARTTAPAASTSTMGGLPVVPLASDRQHQGPSGALRRRWLRHRRVWARGTAPQRHPGVVNPSEHLRKFGDPDASFAIDGRTFDVVRKILAARSAVFKAELEGAGGDTPVIRPEHKFKACTFCALLLYVYCDRLLRDNECGCPVTVDLLRELLAAADWYALDRLKLLCVRKLWDDLSVASVSKMLWYADRYKCPQLKRMCIDFLAVGDNFKNAFSTEEFGWLIQNSPSLLDELRRKVWGAQRLS
ncbi:hypothetical protein BAE44_0021789 [Dichanthelium oligosanthes]|uniref:BTB domain-containing protein n=1 Tax=Dichanthelium oligosanthes TaxID=888268 RepID=A0A1E5UW73_9POAL|nr:hypothetical protein BAE44_0021789 [Dichanthelium oligosanthes]